jgi:hypothetical protein
MGYDLHITRKEFWADEEGPTISHEEWEAYVATDPEVTRDPNNTENDYLCQTGNQEWPLWWMDGEVFTKNPSDTAMSKLASIATEIGARVQGDDGELYDEHGQIHPQAPAEQVKPERPKSWWRFWA